MMKSEKPILSKCFNDALIKTIMIEEMVRVDNWDSLDEYMEFRPTQMGALVRYAEAALRGIKKWKE